MKSSVFSLAFLFEIPDMNLPPDQLPPDSSKMPRVLVNKKVAK